MEISRIEIDGSRTEASSFDRWVLEGIPEAFRWVEWASLIGALKYVALHFHSTPANFAAEALTYLLSTYCGVRITNIRWRVMREPFAPRVGPLSLVLAISISIGIFVFLKSLIAELSAHAS